MMPDNLDDFNRQLRAETERYNNSPQDDLAGLSPNQMAWLNRAALGEGSVVRWRENIGADTLDKVPLLHFAVDLLTRLRNQEIKLTATGNLPPKLVKEWYATGRSPQDDIETGITKLISENDYVAAATVKYLLQQLRWTKTQKTKLSITARGEKALAGDRQALLEELFTAHFTNFNLGYFDGFAEEPTVQYFYGFLLYLMLRDGKEWQDVSHYTTALLRASPILGDKLHGDEQELGYIVSTRIMERALGLYGLIRFREGQSKYFGPYDMMATDLCRQLFRLDRDAQRPEQPGDADIQLRSALFDAEMGSESWTSNDMPPELQELFHEQIRAFHAEDGAGRVTLRSLLGDMEIKPVDAFTEPEEMVDAIGDLLERLQARHVFFQPPIHLHPVALYEFMTTELLDHETPKPSEMMPAFIPAEAVNPTLAAPGPEVLAAEAFLIALLSLGEPLPQELFAKRMRLGDAIVPRAAALVAAEKWRGQWSAIRPLGFAPGPLQEADGFTYQFMQCSFEGTDRAGKTAEIDWTGVVQLVPGKGEDQWLVYGGSFEGEGGGFSF